MNIEINYGNTDYLIEVTENSYDLIRLGEVTKEGSKNLGEQTRTPLGYFTTVRTALDRVARCELAKQAETVNLRQYVDRLEEVLKGLEKYDI